MNKRKRWNNELVIAGIKQRHKDGKSLAYHPSRLENYALVQAAARRFGSWQEAVIASDLETQRLYKTWNKDSIIQWIMDRHAKSLSLVESDIRNEGTDLRQMVKRIFGSWKNAVQVAEIDIDFATHHTKWNKSNVVAEIKRLHSNGLSLNNIAVSRGLYQAAVRHLGSWDNALLAADIDPLSVKLSDFWQPSLVIKRIKERHQKGESLYGVDIDQTESSLKLYGKKFFGSWENAVESAGVVYKKKPCSCFGEKILHQMLKDFFPALIVVRKKEFPWLLSSKKHKMELDFYIPRLNLGVELQGPHHFLATWGEDKLETQQINDQRKRELCGSNGVVLIEIRYDELFPDKVSSILASQGIQHVRSDQTLILCKKYVKMYARLAS